MTSPKGESYHEQDVQHLFRAIRKGKSHLTRFMLAASNNALLNCWDKEGKTPLIECCYIREEGTRDHMVRLLKEAGADVNMKDRTGRTALIHACEQRCNDIVRILIQHCNISPDIEDVDGNTALIHCASNGNDIALELLVRNFRRLGLQVDHFNKAGYTALHVATRCGLLQCAKILAVKGKASLTVKDKVHQLTPIEWCLKEGYQKSEVEFLKPSAKFYRVAKLTTTMVKYRKKSGQDSLLSSQSSIRTSPVKTVDKGKSKVRGLLKKSKNQTPEEPADLVAVGAGCLPKPKGGELKVLDKISISKSSEKLKTTSPTKGSQKKLLGKSPRLRSSSEKRDSTLHPDPKGKGSLSQSHSNPSSILEGSGAKGPGRAAKGEKANGRVAQQDRVVLSDEFGECDTDDLDTFNSETESSGLEIAGEASPTMIDNAPIFYGDGGVYLGSTQSSSDDTPQPGHDTSSYCDDGGVYCGDSLDDSSLGAIVKNRHPTPYHGDVSASSNSDATITLFGEEPLRSSDGDYSVSTSEDNTCQTLVDVGKKFKNDLIVREKTLSQDKHTSNLKGNNSKSKAGTNTLRSKQDDSFDTGRNTATPQTEFEYIDYVPECTGRNKSKSYGNNNTSKSSKSSIGQSKSESQVMKKSQATGQQSPNGKDTPPNSPSTETEYLEYSSYTNLKGPSGHPETALSSMRHLSNIQKATTMNTGHSSYEERGGSKSVSPETEIEYLEYNRYKRVDESRKTRSVEANVKRSHNIIRTHSENVHGRGPRLHQVNERESVSPQTDIEYLDLSIPQTDDQRDPPNQEGESSPSSIYQETVRKSLHLSSDNVMHLVDQATNEGFVIESKDETGLQDLENETEKAMVSPCKDIGAASREGTIIVTLESELSSLAVGPAEKALSNNSSNNVSVTSNHIMTSTSVREETMSCKDNKITSNVGHFESSSEYDKSYTVK